MTAGAEIGVHALCNDWQARLPDAAARCKAAALAALEHLSEPIEVSIVLVDDAYVRRLNGEFRGADRATNVLSFPCEDEIPLPDVAAEIAGRNLGDVFLAFETICAEAEAEDGPGLVDHLSHLVVHGVLHLLGFDHEIADEAIIMERREVEILAGLGIADPYGDLPAEVRSA